MQDNSGKVYGQLEFDIATHAHGLEELKQEDKLKKELTLNFENCEADPNNKLIVII